MFFFKQNNLGFTLIEIMVGVVIFSVVMIGGFQALSAVNIGKVRLMSSIDSQKQIIYFQEKLFEEIKKGGLIDYEEYFNRKVVGTSFSGGHYSDNTGFGNFGEGGNPGVIGVPNYGANFYQCISGNGSQMGTGGCVSDYNSPSLNYLGQPQRYGEYSFQFIDYNSNFDGDGGLFGDEDGDGNIIGDDDDEYIGEGPNAFTGGVDLKELYLISGDKRNRTLFRWNIKNDPNAPSSAICSIDSSNIITGSGCLGTIEFLKLEGRDYGLNHDSGITDSSQYDGVIDTWLIDDDFSGGIKSVAGTGNINYRVPLFPDEINVSDFKIFLYPNKDYNLAWKSAEKNVNLAPYVRLSLTIGPSWSVRTKLKGKPQNVNFSTTISLTDIFSK